jgi:nucleoside phosphorylase
MQLVIAATDHELRGAVGVAGTDVLACGIGPVDAAARTAARLDESVTTSVIHVGIAGARRRAGIEPGTVVIGDRSIYCDSASKLVTHELEPDSELLAALRVALPDAVVTTIGTSADVGSSHSCDVEAMEGFAVLRAAALAGIPAIEVRVVSNEIEEDDRGKWHFDLALEELARILPTIIGSPR